MPARARRREPIIQRVARWARSAAPDRSGRGGRRRSHRGARRSVRCGDARETGARHGAPGSRELPRDELDVKRLLADAQIDVDHGEDRRHERGDQDARDHVEHAAERDVQRDVVERDPARDRADKGRDAEQHREQQHIGDEQPAERRPPAPVDELHRALHRREPADALEHERRDGDRDRDEQPDAREHEQDEPDHHEHGREDRQPDERARARARDARARSARSSGGRGRR